MKKAPCSFLKLSVFCANDDYGMRYKIQYPALKWKKLEFKLLQEPTLKCISLSLLCSHCTIAIHEAWKDSQKCSRENDRREKKWNEFKINYQVGK